MTKDVKLADFRDALWGDSDDWIIMESEKIIESSRWHNLCETIFQESATGKFFSLSYRLGATEYQEDDEDAYLTEVQPVTITKIVYKPIT